jgi:FixJ family two-component response regulator
VCGSAEIIVAVADRALRRSIAFLLQVEGYRVFAFAGAEAALQQLATVGSRVLVIDSELAMAPNVTVLLEAITGRQIEDRVVPRSASILFLASSDSPAPAFASAILRKPILGQSLLEEVSMALDRRQPADDR